VRRAKGDLDGAMADYNEALRLNPQYALAYNNRGNIFLQRGDFDTAINNYEAALRIDPNHRLARENLELTQRRKRESS
jgi:tetratricopeptide (TPR) repeat protein